MKLPENKTEDFDDIPTLLLSMTRKINEIIDYLTELHEQQKPCEHSNKTLSHTTGKLTCDKCKEEVGL